VGGRERIETEHDITDPVDPAELPFQGCLQGDRGLTVGSAVAVSVAVSVAQGVVPEASGYIDDTVGDAVFDLREIHPVTDENHADLFVQVIVLEDQGKAPLSSGGVIGGFGAGVEAPGRFPANPGRIGA